MDDFIYFFTYFGLCTNRGYGFGKEVCKQTKPQQSCRTKKTQDMERLSTHWLTSGKTVCINSFLGILSCIILYTKLPLGLIVYSIPQEHSLHISSETTDNKKNRGRGLVLHPHIQSVLPKRAPTDGFLCTGILNLLFPAPRLGVDSGRG